MELIIIKYIDYVIELEEINKDGLSHGNNLRRNNSLADKLRKIAKNIESKTPKCKNAFAELLRHDNSNVRMWCAHHILEVMNYDDEIRKNLVLTDYRIGLSDSDVEKAINILNTERKDNNV